MSNSSSASGVRADSTTPVDTTICRVTGYIRDINGYLYPGARLRIRPLHDPLIDGAQTLVLGGIQTILSDSSGKVEFDVYQSSTVQMEIPSRVGDMIRPVIVPASSSADLIDLLFPYVDSVSLSSVDPLEIGGTATVTVTATLSNGEELDITAESTLSSSSDSVATVSGSTVTAVSAGTATISFSEVDTDALSLYQEPDGDVIKRVNHPSITSDTATVTVTG